MLVAFLHTDDLCMGSSIYAPDEGGGNVERMLTDYQYMLETLPLYPISSLSV